MPRGILPVLGPLRVQRAPASLFTPLSVGLSSQNLPKFRPCLFRNTERAWLLSSGPPLGSARLLHSAHNAPAQVARAPIQFPVALRPQSRFRTRSPRTTPILAGTGRLASRIQLLTWRTIQTSSRPSRIGIRHVHQSSGPPPPRKPNDGHASQNGPEPTEPPTTEHESIASSMSKYLHLPHRPTKEELLAAANGFWQRFRVRFKWLSIRSMRPWNADEWGAFVSWFILSHLVWILVGTTTFFSLLIFSINTVFAQETLATWIGDYLTHSAGITVVFESAIVPKWKDGVISLRKVYVSRRPGQIQSSVSKGSAAAAAAAAEHSTADYHEEHDEVVDDGNYTQFDMTIDTVNVTLSFLKWWNGKGLLKDVEIKGVRGEVDRRHVVWPDAALDPLSYRHEHQPGDFELDYFKLDDLRVTVHQPEGFRPFEACIYSCELPQLRKRWLFYDLLSANNMSGSYDGSLFTIHTPLVDSLGSDKTFGNPAAWKKSTRLRIDGLRIDHLNRGVSGPFGWIYEGSVDIMADVMLPTDEEEGLGKVVSDFYDQLDDLVTSNRIRLLRKAGIEDESDLDISLPPNEPLHRAGVHIPQELIPEKDQSEPVAAEDRRYLVFDLRIRLNDVKSAVPLLTNDISYVNQALVRPIVAYINSRRTYIPITCRFAKRRSDFDGSWTTFDSGLMDDLSAETYTAFALNVENQQNRIRRLKKVGGWTLSLLIHAICGGMAGTLV
ncbi:hypothetical protein jhhlp_002399 [Lomentospora prolificans]|uniref:Mitochondrial distribution and morphology protein 31 n=1 Tax=Lomentospora prolificans TaxID=41688 RepID=A0A2N3NDZ6_9PEZI|nr:hypothetical protein jhhlp_002399 [Lomentospora prolificans]